MEITKIQDGKKQLEIGTQTDSFDKAYPVLSEAGFKFHSAEQEARARRLSGAGSYICRNGTYVNNAHIYQPKESNIILITDGSFNPITKNFAEATNCNRNGREHYVDISKLRDLAKKDPRDAVKTGVFEFVRPTKKGLIGSSEINPFEVPTDRLQDEAYFQFSLRGEAKPYGQFLKQAEIKSVPIRLVSKSYTESSEHNGNPFDRLLWVGYLDDRSGFYGSRRDLYDDDNHVRGVRSSASAVSASQQKVKSNGQRIARPTLEQVLSVVSKTSKPFVAEANKKELQEALRNALKSRYK